MRRTLSLLLVLLWGSGLAAGTFRADDGVTLHYDVLGKGEPVVLLSGGPGFSPAYLEPLAARLSEHHRVIVLHQRGTGRSIVEKVNAETHAIPKLVADLEALRRELGVEKLTLAGHSWGGILSMFYAAAHPDRVRALALIDSGGPTLAAVPSFGANLDARLTEEDKAAVRLWSSAEKVAENRSRAVLELTRAKTPGYFADRRKAEEFMASLDETSFNDAVFWAIVFQFPPNLDLRPQLAPLAAPVLVIHGKEDPLQTAEELRGTFPKARVALIDGAGHFPWLEKPGDVYPLLDGFLGSLPSK